MESLSAYIEDLTGYLPHELEEIADGGFERIIHPEDREPAWRSLEEQLARSGQYIIEYRIVRKDGSERHILDKGSRSPTSGPAVSLCLDGVLFDMTERKLWEAEHLRASKLESIGKLAGGIAHDFNNILTEINGNIEMALLGGINRDSMAAQALLEAKTACERATEVARQLLTFSKGGTPVKKIGRLGEIARKAADFRSTVRTVPASWCCRPISGRPRSDAEQISQALQNMIVNAAQAMPQGGSITILLENVPADQIKEGRSQLRPGPHVRLSIEDRGTGIDRSILPRIFDPYFTTKPNGSGLGLSTSFSIIHRHDGGVFVDSVPGKGSVFRIYLPALPEVSREVTLSAAASLPVGGGRVLIMDDEHGIQRLLEAMLRRMGYEVTITDDGRGGDRALSRGLGTKAAVPLRPARFDDSGRHGGQDGDHAAEGTRSQPDRAGRERLLGRSDHGELPRIRLYVRPGQAFFLPIPARRPRHARNGARRGEGLGRRLDPFLSGAELPVSLDQILVRGQLLQRHRAPGRGSCRC